MNAEQLKQKYKVFIAKHKIEPAQFVVVDGAAVGLMLSSSNIRQANISVPELVFVKLAGLVDRRLLMGSVDSVMKSISTQDFFIRIDDEAEWEGRWDLHGGVAIESRTAVRKKALG